MKVTFVISFLGEVNGVIG